MKQFITRAQQLGRKAAELRQAVHHLPAQAAQIREAVTMTGGELKQLRADVQTNIQALRADNEDRLLRSMREINDHAEVLAEAGYALFGMDLDLALNQRLAIHLDRVEEVPHSTLRSLLQRQSVETIRSILAGIIKAEETAANVELSQLPFRGLIIHIGVVPMIRMCWREPELDLTTDPGPERPPADQPSAPTPAPIQAAPASMFDLRPLPGASARPAPADAPPLIPPVIAAHAPAATPQASSSGSAWSHEALDRFKKMPGVSKYGR
jgi:hypothetical protein